MLTHSTNVYNTTRYIKAYNTYVSMGISAAAFLTLGAYNLRSGLSALFDACLSIRKPGDNPANKNQSSDTND